MRKIILSTILSLLGSLLQVSAQGLQFTHVNNANSGLAYDSIREMFQDSRGFIWIGTYKGLSRFDGTRMKNYDRHDFGIGSDFVNVINEDSNGNVWIGTDNGIVVYDYRKDVFNTLSSLSESPDCPNDRIYAISPNSKGIMWISSRGQGLFSCDVKDYSVSFHPLSEEAPVTDIYRIVVDRYDRLFLARYCDNIYCSDEFASSIEDLDAAGSTALFAGDDIEGMCLSAESNNVLYVASKRNGLVEVNLLSNRSSILYPLVGDTRPIALALEGSNAIWMSTTNGAVRYNLSNGESKIFRKDKSDKFTLSDDYVTKVIADNKGGIWIGTQYGGINYYGSYQQKFRKYYRTSDGQPLDGCIVKDFAEDKSGTLWVATERAGLLYRRSDNDLLYKLDDPTIPDNINAICADGDYLWIGSHSGIYQYDILGGKVKYYKYFAQDEAQDNRVVTIYKSMIGDIYVGTTVGVMKYDYGSDSFEKIMQLGSLTVEDFKEDNHGTMWLASYSSGAWSFNLKTGEVQKIYRPQENSEAIPDMTSSICIDADGCPWVIGFTSGFFKYDRERDSFVEFSTHSKPSLPTDVYFTGITDGKGNLWLSTDHGLVEYTPHNGEVKVFTEADGLLDASFKKSGIRLSNGQICFGSANGFIGFDPAAISDVNSYSDVTVSAMTIGGETVTEFGNIDLQRKIILKPDENSIGFQFALLDSPFPASDRVACKLEGYDQQWRDVSASKSANYYNLKAGTYVLRIGNTASENVANNFHEPITIVVRPRFWASKLGILTIVLLLCALLSVIGLAERKAEKRRNHEKMLEFQKRKDEEMIEEKMTFFSNIIHEIKTPLTLIRTPLQKIIKSGKYSDSVREDLEVINNSAEYMDRLVKELLEFVRLEKHGYVLDTADIDIIERIGFVCFNFKETAKDKNVRLKFKHDDSSIITTGDKEAVFKILNNVVDNAVKYANSFVEISAVADEDNVVIRISNDGPMISESRRSEIFKPFVQFSSEKKPYSQSFGIGLPYARKLAELHGGTLELVPDPDLTVFELKLPFKASVVPAKQTRQGESVEEVNSNLPLVLVVEDNAELLAYIKKTLRLDYSVIISPSAEKGLELLKHNRVDIILTDIALEGMSGVEFCSKVRNDVDLSHIPIIVLSAISSVETKIKCMENGASMYIEKPFSMDYLQACIKGVLDRRETLRRVYREGNRSIDISQFNLPDRDEEFIRRLDLSIMENLGDPDFSNKELEKALFMSHSTLNRKLKALLGTTPNDYIRTKRLSVAADMLSKGNVRVSEVCYAVGFSSPSYFAKCFKNVYGCLPMEYQKD